MRKPHVFCKRKLARHTRGVGGTEKCHFMTHEGGRGLKAVKKCHVLFEWPLTTNMYEQQQQNLAVFNDNVLT